MRITDTSDLWWKTAVVYCLDVETFMDWNGDGCGDFAGLAQRLDYLADLGVTCLWLMPFYPTGDRDDGYDITDFYGVDPRLGTHGDLVEVVRTAKDRGMRVIVDLVVNHTSDKHPWFRAAERRARLPVPRLLRLALRPAAGHQQGGRLPRQGEQHLAAREKTGEWYLHRFYKQQPDLNVTDPRVRDEIAKAMGFWLELGLSGSGWTPSPSCWRPRASTRPRRDRLPDPHEFLRHLRAFVGRRTGAGVLLGEVNLPHPQQAQFFGGEDGNELTMQFDFISMQSLYLSLARADAGPLAEALTARPPVSPDSQWATFVRNHDELTLDKLSDAEREEVFAAFGPGPGDAGLRPRPTAPAATDAGRRPAADPDGLQPAVLPAGHAGALLRRGDRDGGGPRPRGTDGGAHADAVDVGRNGGFSRAPHASRCAGRWSTGGYGPEHVNVADQRTDPDSLLSFMKLLIRRYRECPELGWGEFELLPQPHADVLAHQCRWEDGTMVAVHNLGAEPRTVPLALDGCDSSHRLADLLQDGSRPMSDKGKAEVRLEGYGYRWLRVVSADSRRLV